MKIVYNIVLNMQKNIFITFRLVKFLFLLIIPPPPKKKQGKANIARRQIFDMCNIWSIVAFGSGTWTLNYLERKYLEDFEQWFWMGMEDKMSM